MKILYVHIGTPKTGTTAIQGFCWDNRKIMEKYGYCYPDFTWLCPDFMMRRNGHFLIESKKNADGSLCVEENNAVFRQGMDRVRTLFSSYERVILSDEGIWKAAGGKRKSLWEELKAEGEKGGYQIKILVYLRRQDNYLSSSWNQIVKLGTEGNAVKSWDEYIADIPKDRYRTLDYYKNLKAAEKVLGKESIIVRRYEAQRFFGGTIYSDFLDAVGMTLTEEFAVNKEIMNTSLTGNMHEIKRVLNGVEAFGERENRFFLSVLKNCSLEPGARWDCSMFSKEEAQDFLGRYEKGNRRIAEEYLGEETELFDMEIPDVPKWQKGNAHMEDDLIRFIGMSCVALMEENERLSQKQKALSDQLKRLKWQMKHPLRAIWYKLTKKEYDVSAL